MKKKVIVLSLVVLAVVALGISAVYAQGNGNGPTISFKPAFALKFLKQNTVDKNRPQIIKVSYNYYKSISESLADLEPYFSPICKHLGIRAVTSNVLEEL